MKKVLHSKEGVKPWIILQTFMGAFHYVCLGESPMLESCPPEQLDSIEVMVPAGSATPDSVADKFRAKLKNLKAYNTMEKKKYCTTLLLFKKQITINPYGLSELGLFTLGSNQKNLGEILPYAEVNASVAHASSFTTYFCLTNCVLSLQIKDPDTEELCRPGQQGEICAKSCSTMLVRKHSNVGNIRM